MTPRTPGRISPHSQVTHSRSFLFFDYFLSNHTCCLYLSDSSGMWEDNDVDEAGDGEDEDEDEGLAGQLLSDLIASNKYGTIWMMS